MWNFFLPSDAVGVCAEPTENSARSAFTCHSKYTPPIITHIYISKYNHAEVCAGITIKFSESLVIEQDAIQATTVPASTQARAHKRTHTVPNPLHSY